MKTEMKTIIAPLLLIGLLSTAAVAAEETRTSPQQKEAAVSGKTLAEIANTAAVRDAVRSVLADTKMELDIHFNGRTSMIRANGP